MHRVPGRVSGRSPRRGFSLVEVLVALAVFGIAIALLLPSFAYFSRINDRQEDRSGAVRAVELVVDELRATAADFSDPPWPASAGEANANTRPISNGLGTFTVRYWFCAQGAVDCLTSTNARNVFAVVSVGGRDVYELETIITRFADGRN